MARIADDHPLDLAFAVDENADLAPYLSRNLGQLPSKILGDEFAAGYAPLIELLEPLALLSLETGDVAFELVNVAASFLTRLLELVVRVGVDQV